LPLVEYPKNPKIGPPYFTGISKVSGEYRYIETQSFDEKLLISSTKHNI
jgi:hypothetical protein